MSFRNIKILFFLAMGFALMISCDRLRETKSSALQNQNERPVYLYKVLSLDDWAESCKTIHLSSMDADFIHLSTEDQLDKIIEKYWGEASAYMLLKLETAKLSGNLVLEANPGGSNKYYHLYNGSIPLIAIVEAKVYRK